MRVLVLGDAILDRYVHGTTVGLCCEGPVPTVSVHGREDRPGGAANVGGLGAVPLLVASVGTDVAARDLNAAVRAAGILTEPGLVRIAGRLTMVKQRITANGQLVVRTDEGTLDPVGEDGVRRLLELIDRALDGGPGTAGVDATIVSDYGGGALPPGLVEGLAARRDRLGALTVNGRDVTAFAALRPQAATPNYAEAVAVLGLPPGPARHPDRAGQMTDAAEDLLVRSGAGIVVVTLDRDGAVVLERGRPAGRAEGDPGPDSATIGAGDVFTAAFGLALATGAEAGPAAELAATASVSALGRPGTVVCRALEVRRRLGARVPAETDHLPQWLVHRDRSGPRVFTNGCFDILHGGHVSCLSRARELGDLLVVAVNYDDSVRRLKGPGRPVNPLAERMRVLAALACVDLVVPFSADSPVALIEALRPEVYVKGAGHDRAALVEIPVVERLGGTVHLLPELEQRSTTRLIDRILDTGRPSPI